MKIIKLLTLLFLLVPSLLYAESLTNDRALAGLNAANVIFDVNQGNPQILLVRLNLIEETVQGLVAGGVKGDVVVSFRGKASYYLTRGDEYIAEDEATIKAKIQQQVKQLLQLGYRLEQCAVATRLLKIDNADIIPEVTLVSNGYVSMVGYQAKGYAMVPME